MVLVAAMTCPFEMTLELPVVVVDRASLAHGIAGHEAGSIRSAPAPSAARQRQEVEHRQGAAGPWSTPASSLMAQRSRR